MKNIHKIAMENKRKKKTILNEHFSIWVVVSKHATYQ